MDRIHRHKRRLYPCPDVEGRQKIPAIQSEQEDLPVHLSNIRIGNVTAGVHQASENHSGMVKAAMCQNAHLLGRLDDLHRVSRTGLDAFRDDHHATPEARMGHQFREVRPNTQPGLPVSGNALQHSTVHSGAPAENASSQFISTEWPTPSSQPLICTGCWARWCLWQCWYVMEG